MCQCWEFKPESRPSFSNLVKSLSKFLESISHYIDFNTVITGGQDELKETEIEINPVE